MRHAARLYGEVRKVDEIRHFLDGLIKDRGEDYASVSRTVGMNHSYIQQYIKRGTPRVLPEEVRERLGAHFGVHPDRFRVRVDYGPAKVSDAQGLRSEGGEIDVQVREDRGLDYATSLGIVGDFIYVPVYDVHASAGFGAPVLDESVGFHIAFNHRWVRKVTTAPPNRLAVLEIDGDSMWPTLNSGDHALVDLTITTPSRDGLYILRRDDDLQVKRVAVNPSSGKIDIISDNAAYPTWQAQEPSEIAFVGRVIWIGRRV